MNDAPEGIAKPGRRMGPAAMVTAIVLLVAAVVGAESSPLRGECGAEPAWLWQGLPIVAGLLSVAALALNISHRRDARRSGEASREQLGRALLSGLLVLLLGSPRREADGHGEVTRPWTLYTIASALLIPASFVVWVWVELATTCWLVF